MFRSLGFRVFGSRDVKGLGFRVLGATCGMSGYKGDLGVL